MAFLSTEEAKSFLQKMRRDLLSTPNVVSVGFTDEKIENEKTGRKIFRVGVIKKLPKRNIGTPDVFIPESFEFIGDNNEVVSIPVEVVEEGELMLLPQDKLDQDGSPYLGGSVIKTQGIAFVGCLGANADYQGEYRLLSAAHVLTRFDRSFIGKEIEVRNEEGDFVNIGATVTDQVDVVLYDTATEPNPVYAKQDLAWANITKDKGSPEIIDIGIPGKIRKVKPGEKVKFYAGVSLDLVRDVEITDTMYSAKLKTLTPDGKVKYAYFEDTCRIDPFMSFVTRGDSGTAVVAESDNALLGILYSKSPSGAIAFCKLMLD